MRKISLFIMFVGLSIFLYSQLSIGQKSDESKFQYVGVKKCKICHNSTKKGAQFKVWSESKHAKAYETLATPEAKKIGKEQGIDNPQESEKCLQCHVTGYGKPKTMFAASFSMDEGVGCEACHGPGSEYKSMKIMKDLYVGKTKPETVGLKIPTAENCKGCHNEKSPTYKEFKFDEFWSKIKHNIPKE